MIKFEVVRLIGQHSLILGNLPSAQSLEPLSRKIDAELNEVSSFGLFDVASPNFSTYYPDVKESDLNPEGDAASFVYPVFRGLSEVIVHKRHNPIDFSENEALKNSMGMLKGQTVYPNHEMAIGNELGAIFDEVWQNGYTTASGVKVPAGINVRLKIDGKSNPRIARAILMDPPAIHSTSVTVEFGWEKSHPKMMDEEFKARFATLGEDGKLVRKVVTQIKKYHEISLVPHGADPFAQFIKENGNIANPEYADKVYNSSKEVFAKQVYVFSYKDKDLTSLAETSFGSVEEPKKIEKPKTQNNKMTFIQTLAQSLGLAIEGKEDATLQLEISTKISAINLASTTSATLTADLAKAKGDLTALQTSFDVLKGEKESLTKLAAAGTKALELKRTAVKAQLAILKDNAVDATLLTVVENADFEALTALETDYATQLDGKAPLTCQECNSSNVSRRTSLTEDPENKGAGKFVAKTDAQIEAEVRKASGADTLMFADRKAK
jgi:hypothetical protein